MSEESVIRHCSPTLAGLKTGNLFTCSYTSIEEIKNDIRSLNKKLMTKGLRVLPLHYSDNRVLIYIYRPERLKRDLNNRTVCQLLQSMGYTCEHPNQCITKLMKKLNENPDFPHEIGCFLGYPPEDVLGFIQNKKNKSCKCKYTGCWKVYGNAEKAKETFALYKQCTNFYYTEWSKGKPIERLAVATTHA